MKNLYKISFIAILVFMFCSCENCKQGKLNSKNSKTLEVGMSADSLISIMGQPLRIVPGDQFLTFPKEYHVYVYYNACGTSDNINIVIDTNELVVDVVSVD